MAAELLPERLAVSIVTIGELRFGVLSATTARARARRLETLTRALGLDPLPIDDRVSSAWAALRVELRERGARLPVNDAWIAATAIAHGLTVISRDGDYEVPVADLRMIRV